MGNKPFKLTMIAVGTGTFINDDRAFCHHIIYVQMYKLYN